MKSIEVHEQSCSQQDHTVQAYLDSTCRLEDKIIDLKKKVDLQRSRHASLHLECSKFIRMLAFAIWRMYDSIRKQTSGRAHETRQVIQGMSLLNTQHEASHCINTSKPDSVRAAVTSVAFSVWSCALALCQVRKLRSADLRRKFSQKYVARVLVSWSRFFKKAKNRVKSAKIISRRVEFSLAKYFMRLWSGAYFTYSAFLKIRMCRTKNLFQRVLHTRLSDHWHLWKLVSGRARFYALVVQRSVLKKQRQLLVCSWGTWYIFVIVQRQQMVGDLVSQDASQVDLQTQTRWYDAEDGEAGRVAGANALMQSARPVHLLAEKEKELRDVREQLHLRDENFGHLRAALAESESRLAEMEERLSSEMAVSELDESVALDRVENLAMKNTLAEDMMKDLKSSIALLSASNEALKTDLETARDQAVEARRELKTCKRELAESQQARTEQDQILDKLQDVSAGLLTAGDLSDEVRFALAKHQSDVVVTQLNLELETLKEQLQARDVRERELRAAIAQRHEGDAMMELREARDALKIDLETARRDLQAAQRELEICKGSLSDSRNVVKSNLGFVKEQEQIQQTHQAKTSIFVAEMKETKEKAATLEARALSAEGLCNDHLQALQKMQVEMQLWHNETELYLSAMEMAESKTVEDMRKTDQVYTQSLEHIKMEKQEWQNRAEKLQVDMQTWQSKAEEYLSAKEAAEAKALMEMSKAEDMGKNFSTQIREARESQQSAAKQELDSRQNAARQLLQQAQKARDEATQREQDAHAQLREAQNARDEAVRREERVKAELTWLQRSNEETRAELLEALDAVRTKDEGLHQQQLAADLAQRTKRALETHIKAVQERSAKEVSAQEAKFSAQEAKLIAVTDALEKLRKQKVEIEVELGAARLIAERASTEGALLQSSFTDLTETHHRRVNEMVSKEEEIRKLQRESAGCAAMSDAIEKLRSQNVELDGELTTMRIKAEGATTQGRLLQASLSDLMQVRQRIEKELAAKNEDLFKLQHQNSSLRAEQERLESTLQIAERVHQEKEGEQKGRIGGLMSELDAMRAQRRSSDADAQQERKRLEDKNRSLTMQIEGLTSQLGHLEEDAIKARQARDQAVYGEEKAKAHLFQLSEVVRKQENVLTTSRVSYDDHHDKHSQSIDELNSETDTLRAQLATLEMDVFNTRLDRDKAVRSEGKARADLERAQDDLRRLSQEVRPEDHVLASNGQATQAGLVPYSHSQARHGAAGLESTADTEALRLQLANSRHDRDQAILGEERAQADLKRAQDHLLRLSQEIRTKDDLLAIKEEAATRGPTPSNSQPLTPSDSRESAPRESAHIIEAATSEVHTLRREYEDMIASFKSEADALKAQLKTLEKDELHARLDRDQAVLAEEKALAELQKLSEALQSNQDTSKTKPRQEVAVSKCTSAVEEQQHTPVSTPQPNTPAPGQQVQTPNAVAAAPSVKAKAAAVGMKMKLGLHFNAAGEEGSKARKLFEKSLTQDLASASGMVCKMTTVYSTSAVFPYFLITLPDILHLTK